MAVNVARLEALLVADTKGFDRSMDKSESRMESAGKTAGRVGLAIAGGLAFGIERSVKAAMDAQVSQSRLEIAFKNSGLSAARYAGQVNILEASGRKLGFTDEQTKNALGSLLIATKSMSGASRDLSVAQDVARFKHVDLTAATKMLTMAMAGSQRATKQLGIDVPKVTSAQDALKASSENLTTAQGIADLAAAKLIDKHRTESLVIDTVRQKLGGQADAYSQTAAGGMEQFRAQLDHLEVSMGTGLLPILARVAGAVAAGTEYFSKHATMAKILVGALGVLAAALIAARTAQILMNLAVLANPYVAAIAAVVAAGIAIYVFRDKLMNVFNWIKDHWPQLTAILAGPIGIAVLEIVQHRDRLLQIFTNLPGQVAGVFAAGADLVKNAVVGLFHKVIHWVKEALGIASPSTVFYEIGKNSILGYIHGVGSMAGVLKDAVVNMAKNAAGSVIGAIPGAKGTIVGQGPGSGVHASPDVAKQFAVTQLKNFGWGPSQMIGLSQLWTGESGWRWNAQNASSGAYGIPQSLPGSKMASAGSDWHENAFTQIMWGLRYIKDRYGSPDAAWSAWKSRSPHWYGKGGVAGLRGPEVVGVGESGPEAIIPLTKVATATAGMTWAQKMQDFMQRVWSVAAPFYGGGSMPIADFLAPGSGMGAAQIEGEGAWGSGKYPPAGKRRILWPAELTQALFGIRGKGIDPHYSLKNLRQWALNTLLHEWTHAFQGRSATGKEWTAEGGAVDFVKMFGQRIYSMLGIDYNSSFSSGAIYESFAQRVMKQLGPEWVARGQFKSFDSGGWLKPGLTLAYNGTGRPESVGGGNVNVYLTNQGVLGSKAEVMGWLRSAAQEFKNRNGQGPF